MNLLQRTFWALASVGRRIGGIRPRRLMYALGRMAFGEESLSERRYQIKTSWGGVMSLHPFYLIDREIIANGSYDPALHSFIDRYVQPGMVVFDVGANIGEVALHMAKKVGPAGEVFAFEPVPGVRDRLIENVALNRFASNVRVETVALSSKRGSAPFAVAEANTRNQGMGSLVNRENEVVSGLIQVFTGTLDEFVDERGIKTIDFIKVDIQGAEMLFLEGATVTIRSMSPDIVIEVSEPDLKCASSTPTDLIKKLEDLGYQIYLFNASGLSDRRVTSEDAANGLSVNVYCTKRRVPRTLLR